jgi:hypothetical protein
MIPPLVTRPILKAFGGMYVEWALAVSSSQAATAPAQQLVGDMLNIA